MITKRDFQKEKIVLGDKEELIRLVWAVSPLGLSNKFKEYGIVINNEDDLDSLIRLAVSGNDKEGIVKKDGAPLVFDSMKILNEVSLPYETIKQSGINIY